jgi:alkaline phosphatase
MCNNCIFAGFKNIRLCLRNYYRFALVIILQSVSIFIYSAELPTKPKAKYVFYFIGDGMGLAQVSAAEAFLAAHEGQIRFEPLHMSKLPVIGLSTTYATNRLITCSAAAGTALASVLNFHQYYWNE